MLPPVMYTYARGLTEEAGLLWHWAEASQLLLCSIVDAVHRLSAGGVCLLLFSVFNARTMSGHDYIFY